MSTYYSAAEMSPREDFPLILDEPLKLLLGNLPEGLPTHTRDSVFANFIYKLIHVALVLVSLAMQWASVSIAAIQSMRT